MSNELLFTDISTDDLSFMCPPGLQLAVLRLDRLHPIISGNKWFKMRYYFDEAKRRRLSHIITFGGAWSNHLVAAAAMAKIEGLRITGIVRGEEPAEWSFTLKQSAAMGMALRFISRGDYAVKKIPAAIERDQSLVIPEGGYGITGMHGAATIHDFIDGDFTHYVCAVGTGTMLAGLASRAGKSAEVIGIPVLKGSSVIESAIRELLPDDSTNWLLVDEFHFGGYARKTTELIAYMNTLCESTGIPTDFVYTGKLFYGLNQLMSRGFFPEGSRILLIHSGGLQGNASLPPGTLTC